MFKGIEETGIYIRYTLRIITSSSIHQWKHKGSNTSYEQKKDDVYKTVRLFLEMKKRLAQRKWDIFHDSTYVKCALSKLR